MPIKLFIHIIFICNKNSTRNAIYIYIYIYIYKNSEQKSKYEKRCASLYDIYVMVETMNMSDLYDVLSNRCSSNALNWKSRQSTKLTIQL